MITNDRQYGITKTQLGKLRKAACALTGTAAKECTQLDPLAKAELDALESEVAILTEQLHEYESLKSGAINVLRASSLSELHLVLIRARIARGFSQRELSERLGLKEQQVQRYEAECYASASLKRLAEVAEALNLDISEVAELSKGSKPTPGKDTQTLNWSAFPVREMYRRGWFKGFADSLSAAMACGEELVKQFVQEAMPRRQPALLRQGARLGGNPDAYALLAWQCQILRLASVEKGLGRFDRKQLTADWFRKLAQLSQYSDGPQRAKKFLAQHGIPIVFESHLPQTYLDGAAFLPPDGRPVIGMTLRYDRTDNFWFVLFHELAHVVKHLRKGGIESIFDDLDAKGDSLECEADAFAGAMLIPDDRWETSLARYMKTDESVRALADELNISPAIVAGRIRKESDNYVILSEIVGPGEVRKQFAEVQFG